MRLAQATHERKAFTVEISKVEEYSIVGGRAIERKLIVELIFSMRDAMTNRTQADEIEDTVVPALAACNNMVQMHGAIILAQHTRATVTRIDLGAGFLWYTFCCRVHGSSLLSNLPSVKHTKARASDGGGQGRACPQPEPRQREAAQPQGESPALASCATMANCFERGRRMDDAQNTKTRYRGQ
ncbi:MAG: hypothetical protein FWH00_02130 [Oscillospiraceae bacterium]|nr:hypothetical protein [Oscillospiraceae bacterium]